MAFAAQATRTRAEGVCGTDANREIGHRAVAGLAE
jgi:hypothetical protein